jgi:hypothetical protein
MKLKIDDPWWAERFRAGKGKEPDFLSLDGKFILDARVNSHGVSGLYGDILRLATTLETQQPDCRAGLIIYRGRYPRERLSNDWRSAKKALRSEIAKRLFLIVANEKESWSNPRDPEIAKIRRIIVKSARQTESSKQFVRPLPGHKYYEILKVLLIHWLRHEETQTLGQIAKEVGCTYPTIREALSRPLLKTYVKRISTREIKLQAFPLQAWQELVALSFSHRQAVAFVDRTGDRPAPKDLQKRLQRLGRADLAFGGVLSARYWDKSFDLHGTPRVDVTLHAKEGKASLDFVKKLDPALQATESPALSAVLVVHPIFRTRSFFRTSKRTAENFSDPIEAALDLYEVGLNTQAVQLLRNFRPEIRF